MSYNSKVYMKQEADEMVVASGGAITAQSGAKLDAQSGSIVTGLTLSIRTRATVAQANAGLTLLAALDGYKYRLVDATMIAIGGNVATVTTLDILGTQAASEVKLVAFAQAQLLRSVVLRPGITGAAVLTDGASFVTCDENKPIRLLKTGTDAATATHVDVILTYVIEAA